MNKKQSVKQRVKQVGMVVFMILIALGFMVPGFLDSSGSQSAPDYVEPRLCQSDTDCYLTCEDAPVKVLCSSNLCVQNSCEEGNPYLFNDVAKTLSLEIEVEGDSLDLNNHFNSQSVFVKNAEKVELFASGLSLNHVLEKFGMAINSNCLFVGQDSHCGDAQKDLVITVNGEEKTDYLYYAPAHEDVVDISFS